MKMKLEHHIYKYMNSMSNQAKHPYNKQAKWAGGILLALVIGATIWAGFLLNNYYISQSI
jgi:sterol desaturase/sphingolipid hydroxylase (fatty acid hydroxylase superfamily)